MTTLALEVKQISKSIQTGAEQLFILQEVSFTLPIGDSLAIIGRSGSGKSTLLALLAGLDHASSGDIILYGHSLAALNEEQRAQLRAQLTAFVFQSFQLLPDLTAFENVSLPLSLLGHEQPKQLAQHWLERVGLAARLSHRPHQLSGGEQQRVALARAFASSPKILFADEPTGSLDQATGLAITELMFDLNRETHTTLVLVTHDNLLAERCQHIVQLVDGRIL